MRIPADIYVCLTHDLNLRPALHPGQHISPPPVTLRGPSLQSAPVSKADDRIAAIDYAQYVALRVVSMFMHCWPVDLNLGAAAMLGDLMYAVDRKHRDRALANLRRSFPEMPERQRREMARHSMRHLEFWCTDRGAVGPRRRPG